MKRRLQVVIQAELDKNTLNLDADQREELCYVLGYLDAFTQHTGIPPSQLKQRERYEELYKMLVTTSKYDSCYCPRHDRTFFWLPCDDWTEEVIQWCAGDGESAKDFIERQLVGNWFDAVEED